VAFTPAPNSLYNICFAHQELKTYIDGKLTKHSGDLMTLYGSVVKDKSQFKNPDMVRIIFAGNAALRTPAFGTIDDKTFAASYEKGRAIVLSHMADLTQTLVDKSFPETYFHSDVAHVLSRTGHLLEEEKIQTRVNETGAIIFGGLGNKDVGLLQAFLLAYVHAKKRGSVYTQYNEDSIQFTLLTFSYFLPKKFADLKDDSVFFFWKVVGSLMGLGPTRLPRNFTEAQAQMKSMHASSKCAVTPDAEKLLDAYRAAYDLDESVAKWPEEHSKRMKEYVAKRTAEGK
jgi:hypothetical protein